MAQKPTILMTGVSGNLGLRLLEQLADFQVIGVDFRPPEPSANLALFEKIDLAEERSCNHLLDLMRAYRPDAVAHLAFVADPGALDRQRMRHINVSGTGRVVEAIAEHNRMLGGILKFVFTSSVSVYGPNLPRPVAEEAPLQAHTLPYALDKKEADLAVQARANSMKCRTYILRPGIFAGAAVQNYVIGALRGIPGGKGALAERLRRRGTRLPVLLPSGGDYLEHKVQFVHVDDVARLVAHIFRRTQTDPRVNIMNVAGRGDPLTFETCARIAGAGIRRVPGLSFCRMVLRLLWDCGISGVPPEALPYMLGSYAMETARLRVFLGDEYRQVIRYTCEEALAESFAPSPLPAPLDRQFAHGKA